MLPRLTAQVTVQSPVCASGVIGRFTWVPSAYRFIDSVPGVEVPVIVMPSVQSVSSSWASIVGAQDIVNVTSFDSPDSTLLFTAVAVNVCSPWLISSGTVKVTVQSPVCASGVIGRFTWVPSAYRFIDSVPGVEVPVIVMPSVQSVSSSWASIVGAQDIVNVTSFDSPGNCPVTSLCIRSDREIYLGAVRIQIYRFSTRSRGTSNSNAVSTISIVIMGVNCWCTGYCKCYLV